MNHPAQPEAFDPDEDLFDFAGVVRQADAGPEEDLDEIFASFRESPPAEELLTVPVASASSTSTPAPAAPEARAVPAPAPAAAPVAPAPPRATEPTPQPRSEAPSEAPKLVPAARPSRSRKSIVAIALSVTLLNSVLAVVSLRGRSSPAPHAAGAPELEEHASEAHAAPARSPRAPLPDPDEVDVAHAHPTLDEARAEIGRGEYAAARQRVYGLLAIIDRLEEPRRGALEADCQFLIAQSLHLEALARMGEQR